MQEKHRRLIQTPTINNSIVKTMSTNIYDCIENSITCIILYIKNV